MSNAYDDILYHGLRERIESSKKNKVLIILHTSTSHGPQYANKYPKEFEIYKPVAMNVEEGEKNVGMLVNAYDNTIRYTDYLLDSLINTLHAMTDWKSAMIFISDHGESLGENKMFMHGLPMKLAPKEQYEIPFLVWTSENFRTYKSDLPAVLEQRDRHAVRFRGLCDSSGGDDGGRTPDTATGREHPHYSPSADPSQPSRSRRPGTGE